MNRDEWEAKKCLIGNFLAGLNFKELLEVREMVELVKTYRVKMAALRIAEEGITKEAMDAEFNALMRSLENGKA